MNIQPNPLDPFTQEEIKWTQTIADYATVIEIDSNNRVRWRLSGSLVEEEILDEFYRNGYISANQYHSTLSGWRLGQ